MPFAESVAEVPMQMLVADATGCMTGAAFTSTTCCATAIQPKLLSPVTVTRVDEAGDSENELPELLPGVHV